MILTNQLVTEIYDGLNNLRQGALLMLPVSIGFILVKDLKMIEPLYSAAITLRNIIFLKYGEEREDGNIFIPPEKMTDALAELDKLGAFENEVAIEKIPLSELKVQLPFDDLYRIYPLIDGEA